MYFRLVDPPFHDLDFWGVHLVYEIGEGIMDRDDVEHIKWRDAVLHLSFTFLLACN